MQTMHVLILLVISFHIYCSAYEYQFTVTTPILPLNAGSNGDVYVIAEGIMGSVKVFLDIIGYDDLERGNTDTYIAHTSSSLGLIKNITVQSGTSDAWYFSEIMVKDVQTNHQWVWKCETPDCFVDVPYKVYHTYTFPAPAEPQCEALRSRAWNFELVASDMYLAGYDLTTIKAKSIPAECGLHCSSKALCKGFNVVTLNGIIDCELKQFNITVTISDLQPRASSLFYNKTLNTC